ncbi:MAG TPA: molybdopterin cofactor-binding domain-containing protein [Inquilinus sp.]
MIDRRSLLHTGAGLLVSFALPCMARAETGVAQSGLKPVAIAEVDSFLAIGRDGSVTVYSGKVDLGTGVRTALVQIAADELDVSLDRVGLVTGDTALTPDQGPTYGSLSIESGGQQIRQAAATARKALIDLAAARLQTETAALTTRAGRVAAGQRSVGYEELLAGKAFSLRVDPTIPTKDWRAFTLIGTPVARVDIPSKCTGCFTYMQDVRVEGMLHGRVVRPPAMGAVLKSVDPASAQAVAGFVKLVREENFLGVVSRTEWGAIQAAQALQAEWSDWAGLPDQATLFEHVRATPVAKEEITSSSGDVDAALHGAARRLHATYDFAIHTHGSIGPSCAVAQFVDGALTCWTASQSTHSLRGQLATMLGIPVEAVHCIYVDGAGCYGRNGHEDAAADAALLSRAMGGTAVRVQWMRADEHVWDPKGPPTLLDMEAGLDADGTVVAWRSELFAPATVGSIVPLLPAELAGTASTGGTVPGTVIGNLAVPYAIPAVHTQAQRLETTPFRPAWIRSPGRMQNTFANEGFLDECAAAAGADPLAFRLKLLSDPRAVEVLQRLAKLSGWQQRPSPRSPSGDVLRGRGLAYVHYDLARAHVGTVAEVEVTRSTGAIRVARLFVAQDCGQIINPDGIRNQIEGNMVQTTSRCLMEEVTFDRSTVTSQDWSSYPIITFPDVPEVVIDLIDRPSEKAFGAGEPSAAVVPAAISNAVFDAAGIRLRSVPITPAKVLAAFSQAASR